MKTLLEKYIVQEAVPLVVYLINEHNINLKVVKERQSKHGDFRTLSSGNTQITVNDNLNKNQFLFTLIHEIAHHVTYSKFGRVRPHGKEWKSIFQHLMLPFMTPTIYSKQILPLLAKHMRDPKASSDADVDLALALRGGMAKPGKSFIFEIPILGIFEYKNILYKRGNKRRTRFECRNLSNNRIYLFNQNVEVSLIKP